MEHRAQENEPVDMNAFRKEIEELKLTDDDIHLPDVDPAKLTEYDATTWALYRSRVLTVPQFKERRHTAVAMLKTEDPRVQFYAYIGNDMSSRIAEEQLRVMEAQKQ